ncbi:MAG: dephospho-CoA kinase [candidate division WOR-3 bacterium]
MKFLSSKKTIRIGIGGNLGSGKTTVAKELIKLFQNAGFKISLIEADKIAWKLYKYSPNNQIYQKIVKTFGQGILDKHKKINRKALASVVFGNKAKLQKLNQIVHPELIRRLNHKLQRNNNTIKILDAALLFFWRKKIMVDYRILVTAPKAHKISRMLKRGYSLKDILARLNYQMKERDMRSMADFIIANNGTRAELKEKVKILYRKIVENDCSKKILK